MIKFNRFVEWFKGSTIFAIIGITLIVAGGGILLYFVNTDEGKEWTKSQEVTNILLLLVLVRVYSIGNTK